MRIRKALTPAILTIAAVGSILAGPAVSLAASAPGGAVAAATPATMFHG
jgi:hypothetical protein